MYDCTAIDVEKDPSWRARTIQKCNVNVNVSESGDRSNKYTAGLSQQYCAINPNVSQNEYYGYVSQPSVIPISQTGFFNQRFHPHVVINANAHSQVNTLTTPYHLQTMSQNGFFTQEQSNANAEEHGASL